jgi:hypothetical protein
VSPSPPERDTQIDLIWTPQMMRAGRLAADQIGGDARLLGPAVVSLWVATMGNSTAPLRPAT